jgi:hypothetical protein
MGIGFCSQGPIGLDSSCVENQESNELHQVNAKTLDGCSAHDQPRGSRCHQTILDSQIGANMSLRSRSGMTSRGTQPAGHSPAVEDLGFNKKLMACKLTKPMDLRLPGRFRTPKRKHLLLCSWPHRANFLLEDAAPRSPRLRSVTLPWRTTRVSELRGSSASVPAIPTRISRCSAALKLLF